MAENVAIADSKSLTIEAPIQEGSYICDLKLIYTEKGEAEYGIKIVVSSTPSYKIENLVKYKGSYIGDNVSVVNLIKDLPYSEYQDGIILRTVKEPYELIVYYKGLSIEKEKLLNNSVAIFALVTNVDIITYELDENTFVYTRKELETKYGRNLTVYAEDIELWKNEILYNEKQSNMIGASKIYKEIFENLLGESEKYIAIDFSSFEMVGMTGISDISKSEVLRAIGKNGRIVIECNKDELKNDNNFNGIIIYATNFIESDNGSEIEIERYYSKNKQEKILFSIVKDEVIEKTDK